MRLWVPAYEIVQGATRAHNASRSRHALKVFNQRSPMYQNWQGTGPRTHRDLDAGSSAPRIPAYTEREVLEALIAQMRLPAGTAHFTRVPYEVKLACLVRTPRRRRVFRLNNPCAIWRKTAWHAVPKIVRECQLGSQTNAQEIGIKGARTHQQGKPQLLNIFSPVQVPHPVSRTESVEL